MKKILNYLLFLLANLLLLQTVYSDETANTINTNYYISQEGNDLNEGSLKKPFRTIQKAINLMDVGDTCYIREGRYHEVINLDNLKGKKDYPIKILPYNNERVIIDGSEKIISKWEKHRGYIYKTKLTKDIWQLFVNDESMSSARWPNFNWRDGTMWDYSNQAFIDSDRSIYGHHYDNGDRDLAGTGKDFTGGIAVLNIGAFMTFPEFIVEHGAGKDNFTYTKYAIKPAKEKAKERKYLMTDVFKKKNTDDRSGYFIEGKLECLDVPGEWFYDKNEKTLYLMTLSKENPQNMEVRGRTLSYVLTGNLSSYIEIKGLNFFSGTFNFIDSNNITIEDCEFLYPSYNKLMLRDLSLPEVSKFTTSIPTKELKSHSKVFLSYGNVIRNCNFTYLDGSALKMKSKDDIIENNLFAYMNYTCMGKEAGVELRDSVGTIFIRNTIHTGGASEGLRPSQLGITELNHMYNTGYLQHDGAQIQFGVPTHSGSAIRYNWSHDTPKYGLRFDGDFTEKEPTRPDWGVNGTANNNVVWNTNRCIYVKGDEHKIYNNLSFDNEFTDLTVKSFGWKPENQKTTTKNNISGELSGHRVQLIPLRGDEENNVTGDIKSLLRDPENLDFRPKKDSNLVDRGVETTDITYSHIVNKLDIGPYEYGEPNYWIPGKKLKKASTPVPPNKAGTVKKDADLMWLGGYKGISYNIYFGTDESRVKSANKSSKEYKGNQENNIYTPNIELKNEYKYYWRIDTINESGGVEMGDTWFFTLDGKTHTSKTRPQKREFKEELEN